MAPSRGVYQAIHDEYRDMATWYDSFWASYTDPVLRRPAEEVVRIIRRRPPPREPPPAAVTVLDVGAGTGALLRRLRDETSDLGGLVALVGAEPSGEMLEQARRKFGADEGVALERSCAGNMPCLAAPLGLVQTHRSTHSHLFFF